MINPIRSLYRWYLRTFVPYVELCASTEHTYISKRLWQMISADHPDDSEYTIIFEKYPHLTRFPSSIPFIYRFYVNEDNTFITTPDGGEPFTCKLQLSRFGHMGFQCVQPTPVEILTTYGIADQDFILHHFDRRVRLRVKTYKVNGITTYELTPHSSFLIPH